MYLGVYLCVSYCYVYCRSGQQPKVTYKKGRCKMTTEEMLAIAIDWIEQACEKDGVK